MTHASNPPDVSDAHTPAGVPANVLSPGSAFLTARMEDAAINASAVSQQMLYDGWLVRWSGGRHRRTRCVNTVGPSHQSLDERLAFCEGWYRRHGVPLLVRVTSLDRTGLDDSLVQRGFAASGHSCAMARDLSGWAPVPAPEALRFTQVPVAQFAQAVGVLRALDAELVAEQTQQLQGLGLDLLPVLGHTAQGHCAAAGLAVLDGHLIGLYDIVTDEALRGQGLGRALIGHLLAQSRAQGAQTAYLLVEASNVAARALYHRYGFEDHYEYWYRTAPADGAGQRPHAGPARNDGN